MSFLPGAGPQRSCHCGIQCLGRTAANMNQARCRGRRHSLLTAKTLHMKLGELVRCICEGVRWMWRRHGRGRGAGGTRIPHGWTLCQSHQDTQTHRDRGLLGYCVELACSADGLRLRTVSHAASRVCLQKGRCPAPYLGPACCSLCHPHGWSCPW